MGVPKTKGYTPNPVRGCGKKHPGGFYLESETSEGGLLSRLTWLLGTHVDDREFDIHFGNIYTDHPNLGMSIINPAATIAKGKIVNKRDKKIILSPIENDFYIDLIDQIGKLALLDRVGSMYYTPWSFAQELWDYGPSRKVSKQAMEIVAPFLPVPIVFCHGQMPIYGRNSSLNALDTAETALGYNNKGEYRYSPTWTDPLWGTSETHEHSGDDHYLLPILRAMDQIGKVQDSNKERLASIAMSLTPASKAETVFVSSWITRGTYVRKDENDPGVSIENVQNILLEQEKVGVL
jgi:hypothetical protein